MKILKFCKSHSTKKVKFYDFNPDTEYKHFIKEVDINEIMSKKYSLNYTEYSIEEEENKDEDNIKWIELGNVYTKISTGSLINKSELKKGIYPYYGANGIVNYIDIYDYDGEYLLIGRAGSSGKINYVKGKFKPNDNVFVISASNIRYIYYLLVLNKYFKNIIKDGVIPVINKTNISKIKVPIPSIEKQNKIVDFLDKLYNEKKIKVENTADYYGDLDIFRLLLDNKFDEFNCLIIVQIFQINITNLTDITNIKDNLLNLEELKNTILSKISINTEPIDEGQNDIALVEKEVIIKSKPKVKKIVKKVKKPLVIL